VGRFARIVVPGTPHHVLQRGVRRLQVFFTPADYELYRRLLAEACRRYQVTVWAYCLMPNHVHLIVVPAQPESLARAFQRAHSAYAEELNRRGGWRGHVWQQRFFSTAMDARHLYFAAGYVLANPVRAGLAGLATEWPWSSAAAEAGLRSDPVIQPGVLSALVPDLLDRIARPGDHELFERIRLCTRQGIPCGNAGFVADLERRVGRSLRPRRRGRPPKTA
jgi:putative transposase